MANDVEEVTQLGGADTVGTVNIERRQTLLSFLQFANIKWRI